MSRFERMQTQWRATSGNLKTEVARGLVWSCQAFAKSAGNLGNLFESLACEEGKQGVFSIYRRSWQKVAQVALSEWKSLRGRFLVAGNLGNEVARGCPGGAGTR
jgi:hypothetical protein